MPMAEADRRKWQIRLIAIALLVAFLVGLVPMWVVAHTRGMERDNSARQVAVYRLRDEIALAALFARRGEYEKARQRASAFFTELRSDVDSGTVLNDSQRNALRPLLSQRDDMITLLARSDPAGVERLFAMEYQVVQTAPIPQ